MKKCLVCECANILYYQPPEEKPPVKCPDCGRDTRHYTSLKADDPRVNILVKKYRERSGRTADTVSYCLVSADGEHRIVVPENGGVIGRTAIGAEELAHNGKISREHMRVMPAKRALGVMVEDISANGTFINGRRLEKNKEEFVVIGSEIKLAGEEFVLEKGAAQ